MRFAVALVFRKRRIRVGLIRTLHLDIVEAINAAEALGKCVNKYKNKDNQLIIEKVKIIEEEENL